MKSILKCALSTAFVVVALDLLVAWAAMSGIIPGEIFQLANLPALLVFNSGPSSVREAILVWVPQMVVLALACGACIGALWALTSR